MLSRRGYIPRKSGNACAPVAHRTKPSSKTSIDLSSTSLTAQPTFASYRRCVDFLTRQQALAPEAIAASGATVAAKVTITMRQRQTTNDALLGLARRCGGHVHPRLPDAPGLTHRRRGDARQNVLFVRGVARRVKRPINSGRTDSRLLPTPFAPSCGRSCFAGLSRGMIPSRSDRVERWMTLLSLREQVRKSFSVRVRMCISGVVVGL